MRETLAPLVSASGDKDVSDVGMAPPSCMPEARRRLAAHQRIGLAWLPRCTHDCAGILADEMGLGRRPRHCSRACSATAMPARTSVAPVSPRELDGSRCGARAHLAKYHGSEAERDEIREAVKEMGRRTCSFTRSVVGASAPLDQKFLHKLDASYLIIDEAQKIKNANSITFKNLSQLETRRRLLLTGTPIENKPLELLTPPFLMPKTSTWRRQGRQGRGGEEAEARPQQGGGARPTFADLERAGGADGETARRRRGARVGSSS